MVDEVVEIDVLALELVHRAARYRFRKAIDAFCVIEPLPLGGIETTGLLVFLPL